VLYQRRTIAEELDVTEVIQDYASAKAAKNIFLETNN